MDGTVPRFQHCSYCIVLLSVGTTLPNTVARHRHRVSTPVQVNKSNMVRNQSQLHAEMEITESISNLTPEERMRHLREKMFRELREIEMERRTRAAQQELERCRREKEERDKEIERMRRLRETVEEERRRQEANQREEAKRRANDEKQKLEELKNERLRWKKVMMVKEEPITRPRFTLSDLKKEQQRRREEAQEAETSLKSLTSEVRSEEQSKRKTLINNWVGEQETHSVTVQEEIHPTDCTLQPTAERTSLKSETTSKSSRALHWLQKRLKSGLFVKKQDDMERKREACRLKDMYGKNRSHLYEQANGYCLSRNSILKKSFF
ncbi:uncharacterized protein [Trachinotus anak]|uniref:uncharacterized protein n=1 Tax=Trachinotus anak TaxID=443729 RepID=UPI0039F24718